MQPASLTTSIIAGDFNFVETVEDRWNIGAKQFSGANNDNARDAEVFRDLIKAPFSFCEWDQPYYTCEAGGARSKIDRMYINQHISYQLDHHCSTSVLEWDLDLSRHRPIVFARRSPLARSSDSRPIQSHIFKREGWSDSVVANFTAKCKQDHLPASACRRLVLLKDAIRDSSISYNDVEQNVPERSDGALEEHEPVLDDALGVTMACLKCISSRCFSRAEKCIRSSRPLREAISLPLNFHDLGNVIHQLREQAVNLSREIIHRDIAGLSNSPPDEPEERQRTKDNILKKIKRLSPGESNTINAMKNNDNQVVTSPEEIAGALRTHWGEVFKEKQVDVSALQIWMEELFTRDEQGLHITGLPEKSSGRWTIRRKTIAAAIGSAKASMPGPDGIPAAAYRALGSIAVDILYDTSQSLSASHGQEELTAAYSDRSPPNAHDFNLSLLCCLPKKPSGHDAEAGEFYNGEDTRPLALVNTDNRILASAARLTWEPILSNYVSLMQQGFIKGRQMLNNVVDIDYEAMRVSLKCEKGAVVFFDFKAAFPSVSHRFLMHSLRSIGLPDHALAFIDVLYSHNNCIISHKGCQFEGFGMHSGVRQGCPISPLLFAAAVDILLRRLRQQIPNVAVRAFADDIGMVVEEWEVHGRIAQTIFSEFANMSGLKLNLPKTVVIPLWPKGMDELQQQSNHGDFIWDSIKISDKGKYLGFSSGPGKGHSSWDAPLKKYSSRARKWHQIGAGTHTATIAYNTYAFTTLSFVAQLEDPPLCAGEAEAAGLRWMLPGPGNWFIAEDAFFLKECYGQALSFQSLAIVSQAAKLRTIHSLDAARSQGQCDSSFSIEQLGQRLRYFLTGPVEVDRIIKWNTWYASSHVLCLLNNVQSLRARSITLQGCLRSIAGTEPPWEPAVVKKQRRELQRFVTKRLKVSCLPDSQNRIRNKTSRWMDPEAPGPSDHLSATWRIPGPPAHIACRIGNNLKRLSALVPPRVASAVLHTIWNGWCTARRFQQQSAAHDRCWLGCAGEAQDSIEHYCRCPIGLEALRQHLRIELSPQQGLSVCVMAHPESGRDPCLALIALYIYGVYMTTNKYRHTHVVHHTRAIDSIRQHITQGSQGDDQLVRWVSERWNCPVIYI